MVKQLRINVLQWQKEVKKIEYSVKEFMKIYKKKRPSQRCIKCLSISRLIYRFQLGKKAVHMDYG